jgi:uncharacterized protein involved in type VI secretion and phage assembly
MLPRSGQGTTVREGESMHAPSQVLQELVRHSISQHEGTPERVPLLITQLSKSSKGRPRRSKTYRLSVRAWCSLLSQRTVAQSP